MSHDWHSERPAWSQSAVRSGSKANGFWAVEIERDGTYQIELRRWPKELNTPINAVIPGGKAITATEARLKIIPVSAFAESTGVDVTKQVPKDALGVTFQVKLKAGKTRLQTWFTDDEGESRGAYYVYVKRL